MYQIMTFGCFMIAACCLPLLPQTCLAAQGLFVRSCQITVVFWAKRLRNFQCLTMKSKLNISVIIYLLNCSRGFISCRWVCSNWQFYIKQSWLKCYLTWTLREVVSCYLCCWKIWAYCHWLSSALITNPHFCRRLRNLLDAWPHYSPSGWAVG